MKIANVLEEVRNIHRQNYVLFPPVLIFVSFLFFFLVRL